MLALTNAQGGMVCFAVFTIKCNVKAFTNLVLTRYQRRCIDDVTTVHLQQTQGIGLSIRLNELLHYSMAH